VAAAAQGVEGGAGLGLGAGLTNSTHFTKIRRIRVGPNSKITELTVYCFKNSEKDKNQKNM
jgi:hypothetical protein